MAAPRHVMLGATAQLVWVGLSPASRDALIPVLRALVANPIPVDAIPVSNELSRYRLQVENLTIGYEVDNGQNVVVVKVILPDSGRDTDDARMLELMRALTGI